MLAQGENNPKERGRSQDTESETQKVKPASTTMTLSKRTNKHYILQDRGKNNYSTTTTKKQIRNFTKHKKGKTDERISLNMGSKGANS